MKATVLGFVLLGAFVLAAQAKPEPEPEPAKDLKPQFRAEADIEMDDVDEKEAPDASANKGDASSGRLFMKKFLLFKNMFGAQQQQPIIPIIVAGGTGTGITSPTGTSPTYTTVTSTGTIPTATGTITTTPTGRRQNLGARENYNQADEATAEQAAAVEEEALQAALVAGAQEYVVTDQEIKGTADTKATAVQPNRVNLRRKNGKKGQVVSVRIPPKYRRYFKNGQKVMLNTRKRPVKRRVGPKRVNKVRRRNGVKNRRRVGGI